MDTWQEILQNSITSPAALNRHVACDTTALAEVIANFPMRINPYFLQLLVAPGDPLWRQVVPDRLELLTGPCLADPLDEENLSPVANLVHKYPDRVLFLVSASCAVYCRFCTRKRKVGTHRLQVTAETLEAGFTYIEEHPEIREVLLSGGDPLLLPDDQIEALLERLKHIPSVEIVRIGSRIPCSLPMRVTPQLAALLKKYHPLYINTHFNHPREITAEAAKACALLADAGIPLASQTVLLKGINDNPATLRALFRALLRIRVKPYYLFQADLTRGTDHFRTRTEVGIELMRSLYGHISGMAIPTFALDAPGGKGKIPLTPNYLLSGGNQLICKNFRGETCSYPETGEAC
jgi:lysine 2,3-aminomutase